MWFKVDDRLHSHPKAVKAGVEALGLWVLAASWCMAHQTDGRVRISTLQHLCVAASLTNRRRKALRLVNKLVDAELFISLANGTEFQFKNWEEYQPSVEQWREIQKRRAEAGRMGGQAKARVSSQQPSNVRVPVPSRPVPTPKRDGTKTETTSRGSPPLGAAGEPAARPEERQSQPQSSRAWAPSPATFDRLTRRHGSGAGALINEFLKVNTERLEDPHLDWERECSNFVAARSAQTGRRDEGPQPLFIHDMPTEERARLARQTRIALGLETDPAAEREALSGGAGLNGASHASVEEVFDRKEGTND